MIYRLLASKGEELWEFAIHKVNDTKRSGMIFHALSSYRTHVGSFTNLKLKC
jgi:hypothetical protein